MDLKALVEEAEQHAYTMFSSDDIPPFDIAIKSGLIKYEDLEYTVLCRLVHERLAEVITNLNEVEREKYEIVAKIKNCTPARAEAKYWQIIEKVS